MKDETFIYLTLGVVLALVLYYASDYIMPKTILDRMAQAIMNFEGYFEGSISYKNNNPGNLKFHDQYGAIGQDSQGHAIFDSFQHGYDALVKQLKLIVYGGSGVYSPAMNFYQVFSKYAEANSRPYAEYVAAQLGVNPETRMQDLI